LDCGSRAGSAHLADFLHWATPLFELFYGRQARASGELGGIPRASARHPA
jgi:hypothetical protein